MMRALTDKELIRLAIVKVVNQIQNSGQEDFTGEELEVFSYLHLYLESTPNDADYLIKLDNNMDILRAIVKTIQERDFDGSVH